MTISPHFSRIAAVMTLYDPPPTVKEAVQRLLPQVAWIILVDNGENQSLKEWALSVGEAVLWIDNPENGLAKAQNLGIAQARQKGADWLLLLDDDSLPEQNMLAAFEHEWQQFSPAQRQKTGVMGTHIEEMALHRPALYIQPWLGGLFRRVGFDTATPVLRNLFYVCASGSLIPMRVLDEIGPMREAFSIYFIDTEFCLRARKSGYDICALRDVRMKHRIGQRTTHNIAGLTVSTTNHGPQARYLMYRNRRILWWEYGWREPAYLLFDLLRCLTEILRITLFESDKLAKLSAAMRGLWGLSYKE